MGFTGTTSHSIPLNMKFTAEQPEDVDRYIEKELGAGRLAGPFLTPLFNNFQRSPIGLVKKRNILTYSEPVNASGLVNQRSN